MHDRALDNQVSFRFQVLHNFLICHLDMQAFEVRYLVGEFASFVDWTRRHLVCCDDSRCNSDAVIVVSERGCLVNDTSTAV